MVNSCPSILWYFAHLEEDPVLESVCGVAEGQSGDLMAGTQTLVPCWQVEQLDLRDKEKILHFQKR